MWQTYHPAPRGAKLLDMRCAPASALLLSLGCVDLDERVETVIGSWCANPRSVTIDCVYDGDTVYAGSCERDQSEVFRLLGVSAPEVSSDSSKGDCFGDESRVFVEELTLGQKVDLQFDVECEGTYERTLAWMVIEVDADDELADTVEDLSSDDLESSPVVLDIEDDGTLSVLLNALIIRAGFATIYDEAIAENIRYQNRLEDSMADAEASADGLWTACADD